MQEGEPGGPDFNDKELELHQTAMLAQDLVAGLLGFDAALSLLSDDRVLSLVPAVKPGELVPTGNLTHRNGKPAHRYHFSYYLDYLRSEQNRIPTQRLWASNALIRFGQELSRYSYFDRSPSLELIRHLRNAVAHGESFLITDPEKLCRFPAFLTAGQCHWEIVPALDRTPLYDFVSVGDIASVIQLVGIHLENLALERHVER